MADKGQSPVGQPLMKIGYYILGETLGVGTFGKVKSKYNNWIPVKVFLICYIWKYGYFAVSNMCVLKCKHLQLKNKYIDEMFRKWQLTIVCLIAYVIQLLYLFQAFVTLI